METYYCSGRSRLTNLLRARKRNHRSNRRVYGITDKPDPIRAQRY